MSSAPRARALIFANGEQFNTQAVRRFIHPSDWLVSADGGLRHLRALDLLPALLIGDLDSVDSFDLDMLKTQGVRIVQHPAHKDETDLELAIEAVIEDGYSELRIIGALGGRLDMSLGNIFLLLLPELENIDARLEDGVEEVFLMRPGQQPCTIDGDVGDRVSLLPLGRPAAGVITTGLLYPLRGETLYPERTRGISNEMVEQKASVQLQSGILICIHTRKEGL